MIYKINFEAAPAEILFELLQADPVTVRDVLQVTKFNFKNSMLTVYLENRKMERDELVVNGKIYRIKRKRRQKTVRWNLL